MDARKAVVTCSCIYRTLAAVDLAGRLLHEGDRASASGRVVAVELDADASQPERPVWFEPQTPQPLVEYVPGTEPAFRPSAFAIPVRGVDLNGLSARRERHGTVEGFAVLEGTWRSGGLSVTMQSAADPGTGDFPGWDWVRPPCPEPAGGWPRGTGDPAFGGGPNLPSAPRDTPGGVAYTQFRPAADQVVLLVASTEPAEAEARLRPLYGDALCVVTSRWTAAQVSQARAQLDRLVRPGLAYRGGSTPTADGQALVHASVVRIEPRVVEWAAPLPDGLVQVRSWLTRPSRA
jgi:hypothetical protein